MVLHLGSVGGGVSEVFSPLKTLDNGSKVGKVVTLLFPLGMVHLDLSICRVASSVESLLVDTAHPILLSFQEKSPGSQELLYLHSIHNLHF